MKRLSAILFVVLLSIPAQAAVLVAPDDPDIRYTGRWDFSDSSKPWGYWIGTSIIAKFEGTSLSASFSAGNTDQLRVTIDGDMTTSTKIAVGSAEASYVLASGLADAEHLVEIVKETDVGRWTFAGFELDDGASLVALPPRPSRRMVFYGDSNLAGYSLESEQNDGDQALRGSHYGYAGIASRRLGAEYHNISRSGATIRSLNGVFDRVDYGSRTPAWDFGDFLADVVVVNVGANDVGKPKHKIKSDYENLLDDLRAAHPDAHIMLYNAFGWDFNEPANYIHEVIEAYGDPKMSSAIFPWLFEQWHGCEYDHAGMADYLVEHLNTVVGWTAGPSDVMSGYGRGGDVANGSFEEVAPFDGWGWRYFDDPGVNRIENPGGAYDGDHYLRLSDGASSHQPNPAYDGETFTVTVWMSSDTNGDQVDMTMDFRDQRWRSTPLQSATETKTLTTDWVQYSMTATAPTGAANPVFNTRLTFTAGAGDTVYIDDVVMSVGGDCEATETDCSDGIDNDCDGLTDGDDPDCQAPGCAAVGESCGNNGDCCSGSCSKGKPSSRVCLP
jgi:lysophospholipase L1-like esterase